MRYKAQFSIARFRGDTGRAAKMYQDTRPLGPDDIADCVVFAVTRPPHVNLETIVVMPTDQASSQMVHRGGR